ncbi:MAG: GntR family transcriptional regulator, partial [Firmicutes bacterium]|nr:GntR family transcriptional regulator [Bacillota bacterium]
YAQIVRYVKRGIVAGNIVDGDEMPSRRVLSSILGVNPNTIQKAYRILEEEGIIQSHAGAKSYVVLEPEKVTKVRSELIESDVGAIIGAMKQSGVSKEEALELIGRLWEGDPAKKSQE